VLGVRHRLGAVRAQNVVDLLHGSSVARLGHERQRLTLHYFGKAVDKTC